MNSFVRNIVKLMSEKFSLDISIFDEKFILQTLSARSACLKIEDNSRYYDFLERDPSEFNVLFNSLNNVYSEFFRDSLTFSTLENIVLPVVFRNALSRNQNEIRVWSAGCSAGQEPYSLAIILNEFRERSDYKPGIRIFGTDKSQAEIDLASRGIYSPDSLQNLRFRYLQKYFNYSGKLYSIKDEAKKLVEYSVYNILDEEYLLPPSSIFGNFDFVMACNILFYYNAGIRDILISRLCNSIVPGGFFITGASETLIVRKKYCLKQLSDIVPVFIKNIN